MLRWPILACLALLTSCQTQQRDDWPVPAAASASTTRTPEPAQRLSEAARRLLGSVTSSRYAHRTDIDPDSGSFVTDCSGLLTWLLRQQLPGHLAAIPISRGTVRPLAVDFQMAFASGTPGWQRIVRVRDVRPGDVLAWSYLKPRPGGSTGHVAIIDSAAIPTDETGFSLIVIDSTSVPHDEDTRGDAGGVGRGTIHLRVDADGAPVAVRGNRSSEFRSHAFSIARPAHGAPR